MLGLDVRAEQKRWFVESTRAAKAFLNVAAGRREGALVGYDHRGLLAKRGSEYTSRIMADAGADREESRVAGASRGLDPEALMFGG